MPEDQDLIYEKNIIEAFVAFMNGELKTNYRFVGRPDEDERTKKAPDFEFHDQSTDLSLYIEMSRITTGNLSHYKNLRNMFSTIRG